MRLQRHCASFSVRPGRPCAILAHRPKPACSSASSRRRTVSDAVHLSLDVRLPLGPQPAASAGDVSSPSMPSSPPSPHPAPWWSGVGMRLTRRRAALSSSITGTSLPAIDTVTPDRGMMRSAWFRSFLLARRELGHRVLRFRREPDVCEVMLRLLFEASVGQDVLESSVVDGHIHWLCVTPLSPATAQDSPCSPIGE